MLKFSKIIFSKKLFLLKNIKIYWNYFFQCGIFNFNLLFNKHVLKLCLYYSNVNPKENSSFKWWSSATIMLDMDCPFACNYACNELLQSYCLTMIKFFIQFTLEYYHKNLWNSYMFWMIQQLIHFNLWFVHLCLDQIDYIDIQEGW